MTSTSIYTPFTYCITFILTGQRYYGVRYAKDCHPDQLWSTYFTSSTKIKSLIEKHGKDSFTFQIRKIFITGKDACLWETKFLTKINAAKQPNWFNKHNGSSKFYVTPESIQKGLDTRIEKGTEHNMKNPLTLQKSIDTRTRNGTLHPMQNSTILQKAIDTRIRNGTTLMNTPESIQKSKDTKKERGIINPAKIPFLSMLHNQKTYSKSIISRCFPYLKQYY